MHERAISWKTAKNASKTPAMSPSFPVAGAGFMAAMKTRRRVKPTTIVAMYWNALAVLTEVKRAGEEYRYR